MKLTWEWRINIIEIVTLIVALIALIISYNATFGQSKLAIEYSVGGQADAYFHTNNTILYEFLVINNGFGATVYYVEPAACSIEETCIPISNFSVEIKYNDEDFQRIYSPSLKSIGAKSAHLVQVVISNVSKKDMPENIQVLVRDSRDNTHIWKTFRKSQVDLDFYLKALQG